MGVTYLTEQQVQDVEDHAERELGREEREKPLGCVHMGFQVQVTEMAVQVRQLLLKVEVANLADGTWKKLYFLQHWDYNKLPTNTFIFLQHPPNCIKWHWSDDRRWELGMWQITEGKTDLSGTNNKGRLLLPWLALSLGKGSEYPLAFQGMSRRRVQWPRPLQRSTPHWLGEGCSWCQRRRLWYCFGILFGSWKRPKHNQIF